MNDQELDTILHSTDGQLTPEQLDECLHTSCICILGHRGSGKSALAAYLMSQVKDRPCYVFDHATPELVEEQGWKNLYRIEEIYRLQNCVIWADEVQLTIPTLDKRANEGLAKLLSIARHRDITLILSTSDSRWVTRGLESWVDCWVVKDCEASLLKNGSLAKKIIKQFVVVSPEEFRLEKNEFLFYYRERPSLDGLHTAPLPDFWDMRWSKPFSLALVKDVPAAVENGAKTPQKQRPVPTRNGA